MDIIIKQEFVLKHRLNTNEMLVFSLLQTFKNVLRYPEIVGYLEIVSVRGIRIAVDSLLEKDLIVVEEVDGVEYYKIKN